MLTELFKCLAASTDVPGDVFNCILVPVIMLMDLIDAESPKAGRQALEESVIAEGVVPQAIHQMEARELVGVHVRLVQLRTFPHHRQPIPGRCCENFFCQGGGVEGTADTGVDPRGDQRVREAGGVADGEPSVPGDDGTSVRHSFADEVGLGAVVVREQLVVIVHEALQGWVFLLDVVELFFAFAGAILIQVCAKGVKVVPDGPSDRVDEFVRAVKSVGELLGTWNLI